METKEILDNLGELGNYDVECQQVDSLKAVVSKLSGRGRDFAESLLKQFETRGMLSDKQMYWVGELIKQANQPKQAKVADGVDGTRIVDMFVQASARLKRMKIELKANDQRVVFKRAGEHSKYSGQIMVTDGKQFGEAKFFGVINLEGVFNLGRDCTEEVVELVKNFAKAPEEVAQQFGRENHVCCFCMRALKDKRSTDVGYGPICAETYGLQWG